MSALAGLLLPMIAAWGALRATRLSPADEWPLKTLALAFGIGIGFSSISTLVLVTHGIALTQTSVVIDALLWTVVGAFAWWQVWRQRGVSKGAGHSRLTRLDWLARAAFVTVAVVVLAAQVVEYLRSPHGQWDAWAIWNQKARFLARGGTEDWKGMLSISWANPGHPMLVSASVARLWAYAGSEPTLVPAGLAVLFALAVAIVVIAALDPKRPQAWLAGAVVIAPTTFVHQVAAQTADLPLAFFVVVTLVQLRDYLQTARTPAPAIRALVVAGLFAGLAAWTKNEGLVLVAGTSLVLAVAVIRVRRIADAVWWGAGLSLPVLAVLWYKLVVAPVAPEYMPATETAGSITQRLLDPGRIQSTFSVAFGFLVRWGGPFAAGVLPVVVIAAVAAAVPQRGSPFRYVLTAMAIMVASYAALWLSAPFDASWLVITTFDRLMVQLWPTLVVAAFSLTVPPRARA